MLVKKFVNLTVPKAVRYEFRAGKGLKVWEYIDGHEVITYDRPITEREMRKYLEERGISPGRPNVRVAMMIPMR